MSKLPPNPYDIGPPDPEEILCAICFGNVDDPGEWYGCRCPECPECGAVGDPKCYGEGKHMPLSRKKKSYGQVFFERMNQIMITDNEPSTAPLELPTWDQLGAHEKHALNQAAYEVCRLFRNEELFDHE